MTAPTQRLTRWERIASELEYIDLGFPTEAVIEARHHWVELRGEFLDELERAVVNPARAIDEENALPIYAIFLAAEMRDRAFEPVMLDLLRLPMEQIDGLIGETLTGGMGRCLASVHGGDDTSLRALATDSALDPFVRLAAVDALLVRSMEDDADPGDTATFLFELTQTLAVALRARPPLRRQNLPPGDTDLLFNLLVSALADLGATRYWPAIEQWHRDNLLDPMHESLASLRETMFASRGARVARMFKPYYVRDTVEEMSWWACFNEPEPPETYVREQPKVGRNDPCPCGSGKKFKKCCGTNL